MPSKKTRSSKNFMNLVVTRMMMYTPRMVFAKKNLFGGTEHSMRWFYWSEVCQPVPEDWVFPNKMTLWTAWHRHYLLDHESEVCPLKFLMTSDMIKQSNGRRNLFCLKMLIKYMVNKCKVIDCFVDTPSEKDVDETYLGVLSYILSLSNNKRYE